MLVSFCEHASIDRCARSKAFRPSRHGEPSVSAGDRLLANPAAALRLTAAIPRRTAWQLGTDAAFAELRPDHMGLLTGPSETLWRALAQWLAQQLPPANP